MPRNYGGSFFSATTLHQERERERFFSSPFSLSFSSALSPSTAQGIGFRQGETSDLPSVLSLVLLYYITASLVLVERDDFACVCVFSHFEGVLSDADSSLHKC